MIYCFLADGFEEMEALCPVDILRRAEKDVTIVGVGEQVIVGSHQIPVVADINAAEIVLDDSLEMIILPGGMPGTLNLEKNCYVQKAIDFCAEKNKFIGAICAAPSVLGHKGLLENKEAICFPGFEEQLTGAVISDAYVVQDGNIITAKGAGVAQEFGLKLVEALCGENRAASLKKSLQCSN